MRTWLAKPWILLVPMALSLAMHLPFSRVPPRWVHVWRQCNTLAVARNFYTEDMNILKPRVDRRLDQSGVTGMQFPSYEWAVALGYHVFGETDAVPRLVSWAACMAGVAAFYGLVLLISASPLAAAAGAWALCFSPDLFYFGYSALPDVLALSSSLVALWAFVKWYQGGPSLFYLLSLAAATLAGLTKLQFLAVGFPILTYVLVRPALARGKKLVLAVYALVASGLSLGWYAYALHLIEISGLKDFGIRFHGAENFAQGLRIVLHNWTSEVPELTLGYGAAALLVLGIAGSRWALRVDAVDFVDPVDKGVKGWKMALWVWGLALGAYYLIELGQMKDHSYYLFPLMPLLFLGVARGAVVLDRSRAAVLLPVLLLAMPLVTGLRILPRWSRVDGGLPAEFQDRVALQRLQAAGGEGLSLVGPDESGCVYFYFLKKKGFGFTDASDLAARIGPAVERGATVLFCNDSTCLESPGVKRHLERLLLREGGFTVWRLAGVNFYAKINGTNP